MPQRITYPVLTEPVAPQPTALPSLLPSWQPQDCKSPAPPASPPWLNAAQTQVFVQSGPTPSVASWAGVDVFRQADKRPSRDDTTAPVATPAQGSLVLGWKLVQEPLVWPVKPSPNDGVRPVLPPTLPVPTLGWSLTQDVKSAAAPPVLPATLSFAGPALPIAPVTPLSWTVIGDGATPAKIALPAAALSFAAPPLPIAPISPLSWRVIGEGSVPANIVPPQSIIAQAPLVPPAALTPLTWRTQDSPWTKAIPVPWVHWHAAPALPPAVGSLVLGWQMVQPALPRQPLLSRAWSDYGVRVTFVPTVPTSRLLVLRRHVAANA
jgi:hypothetical protein